MYFARQPPFLKTAFVTVKRDLEVCKWDFRVGLTGGFLISVHISSLKRVGGGIRKKRSTKLVKTQ